MRTPVFRILHANIAKGAGSAGAVSAITACLNWSFKGWAVAFISELDGFQDSRSVSSSDVTIYRHYPGAGSWAMAWLVSPPYEKFVVAVHWLGRCGCLHLRLPHISSSGYSEIVILGIHGGHGDVLWDNL